MVLLYIPIWLKYHRLEKCIFLDSLYTVDVLSFAGTYFRGQLSPNQFAGINIRATSKPEIIYI